MNRPVNRTMNRTIQWAPFSEKHKAYIREALENKMSVAEGAIRSGKTIDNCIVAAAYLERCRDRLHLASGSTIANAKLNIGVCNGFGLENLFRGRCRWGKYRDNEALFVDTVTGEKIVIFAGGGKADSYKRILGNSYGLWIATEINEHYDGDDSRTSFIKVAFGRQAAALDPLVLWDLNPSAPGHPIYTHYIDRYKEGFKGGYQYRHFTMEDNLSLTPERREEIRSQYDPESVWYRRDILGQRCAAEGLIYRDFAGRPERYRIRGPVRDWLRERGTRLGTVTIGVDFGGSGSATKFQATGITPEGLVIALEEEYIDHRKQGVDPEELNRRYAAFTRRVTDSYGPAETRADSAEQILIRGLAHTAQRERLRTQVRNALKMQVRERIRLTLLLMSQGRLFLSESCPHLENAFQTAVYDPKKFADERLDNGSSDIDSLDAFEYSIEPWYRELLEREPGGGAGGRGT